MPEKAHRHWHPWQPSQERQRQVRTNRHCSIGCGQDGSAALGLAGEPRNRTLCCPLSFISSSLATCKQRRRLATEKSDHRHSRLFGRRARIKPRPQEIFDFPAERPGRSSRGERLKGKEALSNPAAREANGGVAVVAAGAAMNRNGGHHAEVEHP
jgi:hypothetical protein